MTVTDVVKEIESKKYDGKSSTLEIIVPQRTVARLLEDLNPWFPQNTAYANLILAARKLRDVDVELYMLKFGVSVNISPLEGALDKSKISFAPNNYLLDTQDARTRIKQIAWALGMNV